jgi:hypothetical protein
MSTYFKGYFKGYFKVYVISMSTYFKYFNGYPINRTRRSATLLCARSNQASR